MSEIKFRKYSSEDATIFKSLNIEWLENYFDVEPIDERVLSYPKREILDLGGHIIMAEINQKCIGTFAFINKGKNFLNLVRWLLIPYIEERDLEML